MSRRKPLTEEQIKRRQKAADFLQEAEDFIAVAREKFGYYDPRLSVGLFEVYALQQAILKSKVGVSDPENILENISALLMRGSAAGQAVFAGRIGRGLQQFPPDQTIEAIKKSMSMELATEDTDTEDDQTKGTVLNSKGMSMELTAEEEAELSKEGRPSVPSGIDPEKNKVGVSDPEKELDNIDAPVVGVDLSGVRLTNGDLEKLEQICRAKGEWIEPSEEEEDAEASAEGTEGQAE